MRRADLGSRWRGPLGSSRTALELTGGSVLKNEIAFGWQLAASIAGGIFWRWLIVGAIPGMLLGGVLNSSQVDAPFLGLLVQVVVSFIGLWVAVRWLFGSGRLGSMKLVLMEQAHYQKLGSNI